MFSGHNTDTRDKTFNKYCDIPTKTKNKFIYTGEWYIFVLLTRQCIPRN